MYPNHIRSKDQTCPTLQLCGTSLSTPCFSPAFCLDRKTLGHSVWSLGSPQQTDFQAQPSIWSQMNSSSTENKWRVPNFSYTVYLIMLDVQMLPFSQQTTSPLIGNDNREEKKLKGLERIKKSQTDKILN